MKNVFFFTLLIFAVPVFSQSVEFAPSGATWTFVHEVWDSWQGPSSVTVEELRYTEDILIGNLPVKVLEMEGKKAREFRLKTYLKAPVISVSNGKTAQIDKNA